MIIMQNNEESSEIPADLHCWVKNPFSTENSSFNVTNNPAHELEPLQPILDPVLRQYIQDCLHKFLVQRHQNGLTDRCLSDPTRNLGELDGVQDDDGQEV